MKIILYPTFLQYLRCNLKLLQCSVWTKYCLLNVHYTKPQRSKTILTSVAWFHIIINTHLKPSIINTTTIYKPTIKSKSKPILQFHAKSQSKFTQDRNYLLFLGTTFQFLTNLLQVVLLKGLIVLFFGC